MSVRYRVVERRESTTAHGLNPPTPIDQIEGHKLISNKRGN